MTPLDQLRLWFTSLDEELQHEIAFAVVPALFDDLKEHKLQPEPDFIRALNR